MPKKALIIDDDPVTGASLCGYLRRRGWTAEWSPCPVAALLKLRAVAYRVVLLDWLLPVQGRDALVAEVRAVGATVVVWTAAAGDELQVALSSGLEVLRKPLPLDEVEAKLLRVVGVES